MKLFLSTILVLALSTGICLAGELSQPNKSQLDNTNNALRLSIIKSEIPIRDIATNLIHHKYDDLENIFEEVFQQYQDDVSYEARLRWVYDIFNPQCALPMGEMNRWVSETGSYIAYTARGVYYSNMAADASGSNYYDNTSDERLEKMTEFHALAKSDLLKAIELNPKIMPAYSALIRVAMNHPQLDAREYLDMAVKYDPRTFYVRAQYMVQLKPAWGGSYDKMKAFANESEKYADVNPQLLTLKGEVAADKAGKQYEEENWRKAIEFYTDAMKYGERLLWLEYRADCYFRNGQMKKSKADFAQMLTYDKENEKAKEWSLYLDAMMVQDKN